MPSSRPSAGAECQPSARTRRRPPPPPPPVLERWPARPSCARDTGKYFPISPTLLPAERAWLDPFPSLAYFARGRPVSQPPFQYVWLFSFLWTLGGTRSRAPPRLYHLTGEQAGTFGPAICPRMKYDSSRRTFWPPPVAVWFYSLPSPRGRRARLVKAGDWQSWLSKTKHCKAVFERFAGIFVSM